MNSCIKYHGGKYFLRKDIRKLIPHHSTYVETCIGGGQIFFDKVPAPYEVINDLNEDLVNMWRQVQNNEHKLQIRISQWDYSESSFQWAISNTPINDMDRAAQTFIKYRQSLGGRGKTFAKCSKNRLRRGMPDNASAYYTALNLIPDNARRLKDTNILSMDLIDLLKAHVDDPMVFIYIDPPYIASTRTSPKIYLHEMPDSKHEEMCDLIKGAKAKILLSGYDNPLYNTKLSEWNRYEVSVKNHSAGGQKKKVNTEVLWYNYGIE